MHLLLLTGYWNMLETATGTHANVISSFYVIVFLSLCPFSWVEGNQSSSVCGCGIANHYDGRWAWSALSFGWGWLRFGILSTGTYIFKAIENFVSISNICK